jgi:hypothetical protein
MRKRNVRNSQPVMGGSGMGTLSPKLNQVSSRNGSLASQLSVVTI